MGYIEPSDPANQIIGSLPKWLIGGIVAVVAFAAVFIFGYAVVTGRDVRIFGIRIGSRKPAERGATDSEEQNRTELVATKVMDVVPAAVPLVPVPALPPDRAREIDKSRPTPLWKVVSVACAEMAGDPLILLHAVYGHQRMCHIIPHGLTIVRIGRASDKNEIVVDGELISASHCTLKIDGANPDDIQFVLSEDPNHPSTNGTFVNNERIRRNEFVRVYHGDVIGVANTPFRLHVIAALPKEFQAGRVRVLAAEQMLRRD